MRSLRYVLVLVVGVLCTSHAGAAARAGDDPSVPMRKRDAASTLVHQDLALAPGARLSITFHPAEPLGANTVAVLAYRPITLRDGLERAIDHQLSGFIDRVDIDPATVVTDADGNVVIDLPTETAADTTPALLLPDAGLYPLAVRVVDARNEVVDELVTFVARQPAVEAAPAKRISVAVLASVTAPPQIPGDDTPLPAAVADQITALASYGPEVHLSLSISPEILSRLDAETVQRLRDALPNSVMLAQPYVPFDPSSATASEQQDRFTTLLVDGENAVADVGGLARTDRSVWYAPSGITDAGATLLRELGARLLVLPSDTYLAADGSIGELTDYSQLFKTVLPGAQTSGQTSGQTCDSPGVLCMPTAVIDPVMSTRLTDAALAPEQAALYTAADIVVYREQFAESLSATNRHALIIGPAGQGVPDAHRITRAVQMVGGTDAAQFITLDQLEQNSSSLIVDGRPVELHLPQPSTTDLTPRARALNEVALAATTVSSMLVDDKGRPQRWTDTVRSLFSTSVTDDQVTKSISEINDQLAVVRACIKAPATYTFTLTGRSTNLYLRIENLCNEPLKVVVHMQAAADKMEFPDPSPVKLLEPLAARDVPIPVVARTNGTFEVTLDLLTPDGAAKVTDSVTLKARINTLTGLPQLITGAGLLILLTWWVRNLRRSRRQRRALAVASAVASSSHPAVQAEKAAPRRTS